MFAQVSKVEPHTPQEEAKASLIDKLDTYVQVKPSFPDEPPFPSTVSFAHEAGTTAV